MVAAASPAANGTSSVTACCDRSRSRSRGSAPTTSTSCTCTTPDTADTGSAALIELRDQGRCVPSVSDQTPRPLSQSCSAGRISTSPCWPADTRCSSGRGPLGVCGGRGAVDRRGRCLRLGPAIDRTPEARRDVQLRAGTGRAARAREPARRHCGGEPRDTTAERLLSRCAIHGRPASLSACAAPVRCSTTWHCTKDRLLCPSRQKSMVRARSRTTGLASSSGFSRDLSRVLRASS